MNRRLVCVWVGVAITAAGLVDPPQLVSNGPASWPALGDEVVKLVREQFYNRMQAEAWAAKHTGYANSLSEGETFAKTTRAILAELKSSHTGYYTDRDSDYYGLKSIFAPTLKLAAEEYDSPGAALTADHFVAVVFTGGPADRAGLRRGDRIVQADGRPFDPVASFRGKSGMAVNLSVRRHANSPPITISLTPHRVVPKREWLEAERNGARLIAHQGKSIAYVPLFACSGHEFRDALQDMLNDRLRSADALILDFRDGWGGCDPQFVNLFNPTPPILTLTERDGKVRQIDGQWRKPVMVLINGGSRSGKEVVAYAIQKHRLGTLVGQRSAGAVLGGRCFVLANGALLYLAVNDVQVDGVRLEGRGVAPDIEVADALPFADGADPQLEKALDVAAR